MAFQDIPGNDRIKKILKLALGRGRVPNSLLFGGPEGVGKHRMALELAKALVCLERTDDACGVCSNCAAIAGGALPDVLEIAPAKSVITIDQMRELKEIAGSRPMTARARVFIIDPADKLGSDASDSFLKVLEEPALATHFFLVSAKPDLLLGTIRSRCQTLAFQPVADEDIMNVLRSSGMEEEKARLLTLFVRGNLERARDIDWDAVQEKRRAAWELFRALVTRTGSVAFLRRFAFSRKSETKEELPQTLEVFASFARDSLLLLEGAGPGLLFNPDYESEMRACLPSLDPERAVRIIRAIETAEDGLGRSFNLGLLATSFYSQATG
jgi:DNA polymerase-3 subunit delta'